MSSLTRTSAVLALSALLGLGLVSTASARRSRAAHVKWSRISGPSGASPQLGLARGPDGVLNVAWSKGPNPATIFNTRIAANGRAAGTSTVASGWDGASGLAILALPGGGLDLFANGARNAGLGSDQSGVNLFTGQANGSGFGFAGVWGGDGVGDPIGAALGPGGQPVTAWAAAGVASTQLGTSSGNGGVTPVCSCSALDAGVASDGASGAVVEDGVTINNPAGTFVQQVLPGLGSRQVLPSGGQTGRSGLSAGIAGRIGQPGVYVIYTNSGRPGVTKPSVHLYRYGGGTRTIARGPFDTVNVFTGPAGRLWITWGDLKSGLFVTRSNEAVTRFEPKQRLRLLSRASALLAAYGEGSAGPLELFADMTRGSDTGFWHAHVLARLSAHVRAGRAHKSKAALTVSVSDAGDAVPGATVHIGRKSVKTDSNGTAKTTLKAGSYQATVSAPGYAKVRAKVKVG